MLVRCCAMWQLSHFVHLDHESAGKASELCAVLVLTTEPEQKLFHLGAAELEFPLTYKITYSEIVV